MDRGPALIRFLASASYAVLEQSAYFDSVSDFGLSQRWERAVDKALDSLLLAPEGGAAFHFDDPSLAGLRRWSIPGFTNHLLVYRYLPGEHALVIVDVPQGSRELQNRLRIIVEREFYAE